MMRFQPTIVSTLAVALFSFGKFAKAAPLFDVDGWKNGNVKWHNPPSGFQNLCGKVTTVFGVAVCVTSKAWKKSQTKCNHVAHVFYQLLDNDADGVVDDPDLVYEMVHEKYLLWVPATESEMENFDYDKLPNQVNNFQPTGLFEAVPNSCDSPANRGASPTDRSTWNQHIDVSNKNCDQDRDATVEEILHLMTQAALQLWPSKWNDNWNSDAGSAIKKTNGNCGWGYLGNWKDPSSNRCQGQYAYNDETCDKGCIVIEGIYWAIVSYIGGLFTEDRADSVSNEWLMTTPDDSMIVLPTNVNNARSLESGSPELYALVSDTTSNGHKWLPEIMPDGNYVGFSDEPPAPSPTNAPAPSPTNDSDDSDDTCEDNASFCYKGKCNKDCDWVGQKQSRINKLCSKTSVSTSCPVTCGECSGNNDPTPSPTNNSDDSDDTCEDDESFRYKGKGYKDCDWIGEKAFRINKLCPKKSKGQKVSEACPVTCGTCN